MAFRICSYLLFSALVSGCVDDIGSMVQELGSGGKRRRPPPEAVDACKGSTAGAACTFDHDGHDVTGNCRAAPDGNGPLACAPDRPPPPPESFAACEGSTADAACTFDIDGHQVEGSCKLSPDGTPPLACVPTNPPPPR